MKHTEKYLTLAKCFAVISVAFAPMVTFADHGHGKENGVVFESSFSSRGSSHGSEHGEDGEDEHEDEFDDEDANDSVNDTSFDHTSFDGEEEHGRRHGRTEDSVVSSSSLLFGRINAANDVILTKGTTTVTIPNPITPVLVTYSDVMARIRDMQNQVALLRLLVPATDTSTLSVADTLRADLESVAQAVLPFQGQVITNENDKNSFSSRIVAFGSQIRALALRIAGM